MHIQYCFGLFLALCHRTQIFFLSLLLEMQTTTTRTTSSENQTWPTQQKCSQGFLLAASCLNAWEFCCLPRQSRKLKGSFTCGDPAGTQSSTSQHRCLSGLLGRWKTRKFWIGLAFVLFYTVFGWDDTNGQIWPS